MLELKHRLRFLPIHIIDPRNDTENNINTGEELESLIQTFGGEIVERVMQKLYKPHMSTYIGSGKITEVAEIVESKKIDVVVLNAVAKAGQIHEIKLRLESVNPKIEVWDKVDLILHIFEKHAVTKAAKLQIQLARMRYMGPRIYGMGHVMSQQGGGIGTTGIGETNTELMRRHWRNEMKRITDELEKVGKSKQLQLDKRKDLGLQTVSIVGYTNAGKTSLFNALSKKENLAKNVLFATLDSSVGKLYMPELQKEILVSDTIGFIRDLPPTLISAFKSTLMESIHADVLLHVIDVSDPEMDLKINVVNEILTELGRNTNEILYVFNKIDKVSNLEQVSLVEKYHQHTPLFISVKTKVGIDTVIKSISKRISS